MTLFSAKNTAEFQQLLEEAKRYLLLEKRYLALSLSERIARLLGFVVLLIVCLLLGSVAVIAGTFALAFWLGGVLGSMPLGFLCVMLLLVLLMAVVLRNSQRWIANPIMRMMLDILTNPHNDDSL